jgi:hypothetical protein
MSYFGGYGGGRGWLKVHFLLTSAELDALLPATTVFCWTRSVVTLRYRPPTRAEYLADYRRFLRAAHADAPLKQDTQDNLTHSLSASSKALRKRLTRNGRALRFDEREPLVTASFASVLDIHSKLYSERSQTGSTVGLEWSYPEVVSWDPDEWEDEPTEGLANRRFFDARVAWIRAHTRPATITWKGVRRRTSLRVSPEMHEWLAAHPYLRRNRMTLAR